MFVGPKWSLQQLLPDCIELNEFSFDEFTENNDIFFIVFLHGEVQDANLFTVHYERAAMILKEEKISFPLTYVDCQKDRALLQRFGIKRYPTLMIIKNTFDRMFYEGIINEKILVTLAKKHYQPVIEIESERDHLELKGVQNVTLFLYLSATLTEEESEYYRSRFMRVANEFRSLPEIRFGVSTLEPKTVYPLINDKIVKDVAKNGWGLELWKGGVDPKKGLRFTSEFSVTTILEYIANHGFLYLDELKTTKWNRYVSKNRPLVILWTDPSQAFHERLIPIMWEVATEVYENGLIFLWANSERESVGLDKHGLVYDDIPIVVIFDQSSQLHYMDKRKRITQDSLTEFCESFLAKETEPFYKSWMSRAAQQKEKELRKRIKEEQKRINEEANRSWGGEAPMGLTQQVLIGPEIE